MVELKHCPFCGQKSKTNVYYWKCSGRELGLVAEVKCEQCGISQFVSFNGENKSFDEYINAFNIVIEKWNTRV